MEDKPCPSCNQYRSNPLCGAYSLQCLACCRRLILSAYPLKHLAAGHLEAISRFPAAPKLHKMLEEVMHDTLSEMAANIKRKSEGLNP